jgi:hypothetical protein
LGAINLKVWADTAELSRPILCAGAGFHTNQARRQLGDHFQQLVTSDFGLDKYRLAALVNTMQREYIHGKINADGDNIHGLPLS